VKKRSLLALLLIPAALGAFVVKCSGVAAGVVALAAAALLLPLILVNSTSRLRRLCRCAAAVCVPLALSVWICFTPEGIALRWNAAATALFAVSAALLAASFAIRKEFRKKQLFRFFLLLEAFLILCGVLALWLCPFESGTLYELSETLHGRISDDFGSSRIRIWREALLLFSERPLLGGGPDTLALRLDLHFSRFVEETGKTVSTYIDNAHNAYLGYLINTGILGLLGYLSVIGCTAAEMLRRRFSGLRGVIFIALAAAWTEAFFGLDLFITNPVVFIFWGLFFGKENACPQHSGQADKLIHKAL